MFASRKALPWRSGSITNMQLTVYNVSIPVKQQTADAVFIRADRICTASGPGDLYLQRAPVLPLFCKTKDSPQEVKGSHLNAGGGKHGRY